MKKNKKMGCPIKEIDYDQFEKLCGIQCTEAEICTVLNVTDKTLNRRLKKEYGLTFSEAFKKFSGLGKASLRRYQFNLAKTNAAMSIFLGKNILGQQNEPSDKDEKRRFVFNFGEDPQKEKGG